MHHVVLDQILGQEENSMKGDTETMVKCEFRPTDWTVVVHQCHVHDLLIGLKLGKRMSLSLGERH